MFAMNVPFKKLHPDAKIPTQGNSIYDGGLDLCSVESVEIRQGESKAVSTGLAWDGMSLCSDYEKPVLIIKSRSGLAFKHHIEVGAGVIDASYSGELCVMLRNMGEVPLKVEVGDRIAQGIVFMTPYVQAIETTELSETSRGDNGFGSTGVK
jgi:dUTP pyrophosphatase